MHLATKFVSFFFNYFPYPTSYQEGCVIGSIFFYSSKMVNLIFNSTDEPVCKQSQQRIYGALRNEQVLVSCTVDANPQAQYFTWAFNNSGTAPRPLTSYSIQDGSTSVARYTPTSELEYGTLLCWARNEQGSQRTPCTFHVVKAGECEHPVGKRNNVD